MWTAQKSRILGLMTAVVVRVQFGGWSYERRVPLMTVSAPPHSTHHSLDLHTHSSTFFFIFICLSATVPHATTQASIYRDVPAIENQDVFVTVDKSLVLLSRTI
jgi:hypothetical protein